MLVDGHLTCVVQPLTLVVQPLTLVARERS